MKKQKPERYAELEILNGKSHQEIYDYIISTSEFNIHDVAELVRKIPTLEKRQKYKLHNIVLLSMIGVIILDKLIQFSQSIAISQPSAVITVLYSVLSIVLFYMILKFKRNAHLITGFLFVLGSFTSFFQLISSQNVFFIINIIFSLIGGLLSFYLNFKLVSDYSIDKEKQKADPQQRENMIKFFER